MIGIILEWYDVAWFWFGRGVAAMMTIGFAVAIIAGICDYVFNKIVAITIFVEFMVWRKRKDK